MHMYNISHTDDNSTLNGLEISNNFTPCHNRNRDESINYGDLSLNDSNDFGHV